MRYKISYITKDGKWHDVYARTIKEATELYEMVGEEAGFKVLLDTVNDDQILQS